MTTALTLDTHAGGFYLCGAMNLRAATSSYYYYYATRITGRGRRRLRD